MTVIFKNERKDSGVNSQKNFIDKLTDRWKNYSFNYSVIL